MRHLRALIFGLGFLCGYAQLRADTILKAQDFPNVPEKPLTQLLDYLNTNQGRVLNYKVNSSHGRTVKIQNKKYAALIDFSQASDEKRLYILDLQNLRSEVYYVAHGQNSGERWTTLFSNISESNQTSLGFYATLGTYVGIYGYSLRLAGLDSTNDLVYYRSIIMHGADYVSESYIKKNGFLGRSQGCPAVELKYAKNLIDKLKGGAVIYFYHPQLLESTVTGPVTVPERTAPAPIERVGAYQQ